MEKVSLKDSGPKVLIVMGSDSDMPEMEKARSFLFDNGIPCEMVISSAHRTPLGTASLAEGAHKNGIEVIIAGAGMAAHLAGAIAANTTLPVIGVPLTSKASPLGGMDALLSTVQMPPGIPVATVGIDSAKNAAILAVQILSIKYLEAEEVLMTMRCNMAVEVEQKNNKLNWKGGVK
jgi:5-(carboxyamino)imidazole ribonucleotide mutase